LVLLLARSLKVVREWEEGRGRKVVLTPYERKTPSSPYPSLSPPTHTPQRSKQERFPKRNTKVPTHLTKHTASIQGAVAQHREKLKVG